MLCCRKVKFALWARYRRTPSLPFEGRWPGKAGSEGWTLKVLNTRKERSFQHPPLSRLRRQLPLRGALIFFRINYKPTAMPSALFIIYEALP